MNDILSEIHLKLNFRLKTREKCPKFVWNPSENDILVELTHSFNDGRKYYNILLYVLETKIYYFILSGCEGVLLDT